MLAPDSKKEKKKRWERKGTKQRQSYGWIAECREEQALVIGKTRGTAPRESRDGRVRSGCEGGGGGSSIDYFATSVGSEVAAVVRKYKHTCPGASIAGRLRLVLAIHLEQ